jgi:hypothetical protein
MTARGDAVPVPLRHLDWPQKLVRPQLYFPRLSTLQQRVGR